MNDLLFKERRSEMEIIVRKPTNEEIAAFKLKPTWSRGISEFEWTYDEPEVCILDTGEVTVEYIGGSVSFGAGDLVEFPKGLSCVWKITQPVLKHFQFG